MLCRDWSNGRSVYFPCLAAAAYAEYAIHDHQRWLTEALRWAHGKPMPLRAEAPGSVQLELWRQPGRLILHLVNNTGDMIRPIAETIPAHDLRVWVRGEEPHRARRLSGEPVEWDYEAGEVAIQVPRLALYDILVIEQ